MIIFSYVNSIWNYLISKNSLNTTSPSGITNVYVPSFSPTSTEVSPAKTVTETNSFFSFVTSIVNVTTSPSTALTLSAWITDPASAAKFTA